MKRLDSYIQIFHTMITMVAVLLFLAYALHEQEMFKMVSKLAFFIMVAATLLCGWRLLQLNFADKDDR